MFRVGLIHNMPFDPVDGLGMTAGELNANGVLVDAVPDVVIPEGMQVSGLFIKADTKLVWWEYEPVPVTIEERNRADIDFLSAMMGVAL